VKGSTVKKALILSLSVLALQSLSACQFYARSAEEYSSETSKLLQTKEAELKSCYDELLEKDAKLEGVVAVDFTVEAKTGAIKDPAINKEKTTAPEPLQKCVLDVMTGLKLDPPDQREGKASWAYDFTLGEEKS
jgi:hypothetical protein